MEDEKSFKDVLKNVHPSTNLDELKQDISSKVHSNKHMECAAKNYKETLIHIFRRIKTSSQ
jgi:hypothetical protein